MNEFDIISRYFTKRVQRPDIHYLSVGDDAAGIKIPNTQTLVTSIDTMVAGVHFPTSTKVWDIGYKSLAVSVSDIAAMGAEPTSALLSITMPDANPTWLNEFAKGFFSLAKPLKIDLIGGDTSRGPLSVSTVVNGLVTPEQILTRKGAKPGDLIYVSNCLGDAGLALQQLNERGAKAVNPKLLAKLNRPKPQAGLGLALQGLASAAIDISDGLLADLRKLLTASGAGALIHADKIPLSASFKRECPKEQALKLALTAGDDYELCFTIAKQYVKQLESKLEKLNNSVKCTQIGEILANSELTILDAAQKPINITSDEGYLHFS